MKRKLMMICALAMFKLHVYAQQTYQLDIKKSKILWDNRKTMGGHNGYVLFNSGTLNQWPDGSPQNGTFSIDMNSMRGTESPKPAENERVTRELKTPGFFDMEKYPTAVMTVKQIIPVAGTNNYKVSGDLTMKGITNPIEFTAVIIKKGEGLTANAKLEIDRQKWHINLQQQPKSWNYFDAIKNVAITDNIAITLYLVFTKIVAK